MLERCLVPVLLSRAMFIMASWYASSTSSCVTTNLILFHFSGWEIQENSEVRRDRQTTTTVLHWALLLHETLPKEANLQYLATGALRRRLVFLMVSSAPAHHLAPRCLAWKTPGTPSPVWFSQHGGDMRGSPSYMMNSLGWQTVVATPPITTQGLSTVWPPVTDVPASSDASLKPWMISGMTLSLSCGGAGTRSAAAHVFSADLHVTFNLRSNDSYLLWHFVADSQKHQHVVTFCHSHGIEVT